MKKKTRDQQQKPHKCEQLRRSTAALPTQPTVTIILLIQDPHLPWLADSVSSVVAQSYPKWELWLCDLKPSASCHSILEEYTRHDERIKIGPDVADVADIDSPEAADVFTQILGLACGEYIGLLEQHDMLPPWACAEVIRYLQKSSQESPFDILYSDEDIIDAQGHRSQPLCKPDWSPDLCMSSLYACHLSVYKRSLIETIGSFRVVASASLSYDLLLRCTEKTARIGHIPRVLYHKRQAQMLQDTTNLPATATDDPAAVTDNMAQAWTKRVLTEALERRGVASRVEDGPAPGTFRVRRTLLGSPLISIIIPTRDQLSLLRRCVQSIEARTTYKNYEILIIDNGSQESQTLSYLASSSHWVMRDDGPFHFARLCNQAAIRAGGEQLLFLNNDMEVLTPEWLEALLEHAQRPEVGAVGAKLLYPDHTIQHAGVVFGMRGVAGHAHKYQPAKRPGYGYFPHLIRNYSAVTAACLMIRKAVYEGVGGMQEQLAVLYNDADLCVRLRQQRSLIVYTPYAELYHHEGRSRWYHPPRPEEVQYMLDHWGPLIAQDPYYNPNLVLDREDFSFDIERARRVVGK
jgi:GT2 family glycosyltransferase